MWKNPAPGATTQPVQTVGRLWACLAPNRQGYGHKGHHVTIRAHPKRAKVQRANVQWKVTVCYNRSNQIQICVCAPTVVVVPTVWSYGYGRATGGWG
jgi:hypothetical protein